MNTATVGMAILGYSYGETVVRRDDLVVLTCAATLHEHQTSCTRLSRGSTKDRCAIE